MPDRRWAWSVAAALAVAAVLVAVWWLSQPSSGAGGPVDVGSDTGAGSAGDPGDPGDPGAAGAGGPARQPPVGRDAVLVKGGVRIDSYVVAGHRLLVNYTTGVPECYGEVELSEVREDAHTVTVALRAVPPAKPAARCPDLAATETVEVDLAELLGRRRVLDGSYEPVLQVARVSRPYATPNLGS